MGSKQDKFRTVERWRAQLSEALNFIHDVRERPYKQNTPHYVIKNCPCYTVQEHCKYNCSGKTLSPYCQDCTDCVMKQIVELCKGVESIENVKTLYDAAQSGMFLQAKKILQLLDIQEVE